MGGQHTYTHTPQQLGYQSLKKGMDRIISSKDPTGSTWRLFSKLSSCLWPVDGGSCSLMLPGIVSVIWSLLQAMNSNPDEATSRTNHKFLNLYMPKSLRMTPKRFGFAEDGVWGCKSCPQASSHQTDRSAVLHGALPWAFASCGSGKWIEGRPEFLGLRQRFPRSGSEEILRGGGTGHVPLERQQVFPSLRCTEAE